MSSPGNEMAETEPQLPAIPPTAAAAVIPVASLSYQSVLNIPRPGILTAVGVVSIVLSCLTALGCLIVGMYMVLIWVLLTAVPKMAQAVPFPAGPLSAVQVAQVVTQVQSSVRGGLNPASAGTHLCLAGTESDSGAAAVRLVAGPVGPPQQRRKRHDPLQQRHARGGARVTISPTGQTTVLGGGSLPANPFAKLKIRRVILVIVFGEDAASFLLAIYLFILGILTLRDSPSSRRGHVVYAGVKIVLSSIALVATYALIWQFISSINTRHAPTSLTLLPSFVVFAILTFAYPIAFLIAMNTAEVRRHYAQAR